MVTPIDYQSSCTKFALFFASTVLLVAIALSIGDIGLVEHFRRHVVRIVFSPDGATLGAVLFSGHQRTVTCDPPVRSLAISPDGKQLATGDFEDTVTLWDTKTMQKLASYRLPVPHAPPYWLILLGVLTAWTLLWYRPRMPRNRTVE
jgi:WD40 repeat protein